MTRHDFYPVLLNLVKITVAECEQLSYHMVVGFRTRQEVTQMQTVLDTIIHRTIGFVTLNVTAYYSDYQEDDCLGEFSDFNQYPATGCYHRASELMWDGSHWRNDKGQIQAEPDFYNNSREYQFIDIGDCQFSRNAKNWLKYAFQNARRLDRLGTDWVVATMAATVRLDGVEVGSYAAGGFDYDFCGKNDYLYAEAKDLIRQALHEARQWKQRHFAA